MSTDFYTSLSMILFAILGVFAIMDYNRTRKPISLVAIVVFFIMVILGIYIVT